MSKAQIIGLDKFRTGIAISISAQRKGINATLRQSAEALRDEIKSVCPVNTGALKASIKVVDRADGHGVAVQIGSIVAYYPAYLEYGTSRAPARPFVRPAVERLRTRLPGDIEQVIQQTWSGA